MNILIPAIVSLLNTYSVTPQGAYPYNKVTIDNKAIYDYRGINPVGPPAAVDMPIDVLVEVVLSLSGLYTMLHNEARETLLAILWARANS